MGPIEFKPKNIPTSTPRNGKIRDGRWLKAHREFLRWRKTDAFKKWFRRQYREQLGLCYYCDQSLEGTRINVEHVDPKSRGGDNRRKNLVLSCWACNKKKGVRYMSLEEKKQLRDKHRSKSVIRAAEETLAVELAQMIR